MLKKLVNDLKSFHNNEDSGIVQTSNILGILAVIVIGALVCLSPK